MCDFVKIEVFSRDHLSTDVRKKIISYVDSLDLPYPTGIRFLVGVPSIKVEGKSKLSKKLTERFLDLLYCVE